jgi:hypothetical protein
MEKPLASFASQKTHFPSRETLAGAPLQATASADVGVGLGALGVFVAVSVRVGTGVMDGNGE